MKKLIICFAIVVLVIVFRIVDRTHNLADVTKPETIILKKKAEQGAIYSNSIIISGEINGNAEISLILNGAPYKTEKLSGKVEIHWGGDWYADEVEIRYTPTLVTGGSLKLRYDFNDLNFF
jgi:hypothetical protein